LAGGKEWFNTWNNGVARTVISGAYDSSDPWLRARGNGTHKIDGKGLLKMSGSAPRLYIVDPAQTGWRNVELTVYAMRVSDSNGMGGIVGVARTNHTAPDNNLCDSRGIGGRFHYTGKADFHKETAHHQAESVHSLASKTLFSAGLPYNRWVGYKYIVYDLPDGNVKLESWMDLDETGTWTKVNEFVDNGRNFGIGVTACKAGIDPALRLTASSSRPGSETGKPNLAVYFRSDNVGMDGLVYKKMSVREISPTAASAPAPAPAPSLTSVSAWKNGAIAAQTGSFMIQFSAVPGALNMDGVVGLSSGAASAYGGLAAAVRFNGTGMIDARGGAVYSAASSIPYKAGTSYRFRFMVNIATHTYSVFVTPPGSTEKLIGFNMAFRSEQAALKTINNVGLFGGNGSLTVSDIVVSQ